MAVGMKKELTLLKSELEKAKADLGKNPPDLESSEKHVDTGYPAIEKAKKAYAGLLTKSGDSYKKAQAKLAKIKAIVESGSDPMAAIILLNQALKDIDVAEKENEKG